MSKYTDMSYKREKLASYTESELKEFLSLDTVNAEDKVAIAARLKETQPRVSHNAPKRIYVPFLINAVVSGSDDKKHVALIGVAQNMSYDGNISVSSEQDEAAETKFTKDLEGRVVILRCEVAIAGETEYVDADGKVKTHKSSGLRPESFVSRFASAFEEKRLFKALERADEQSARLDSFEGKAKRIASLDANLAEELAERGVNLASLL